LSKILTLQKKERVNCPAFCVKIEERNHELRFEGVVKGRNEKGCIQQAGGWTGKRMGGRHSPLISVPGETQGLFATRRVKKIGSSILNSLPREIQVGSWLAGVTPVVVGKMAAEARRHLMAGSSPLTIPGNPFEVVVVATVVDPS
jgi:hypothetical protein